MGNVRTVIILSGGQQVPQPGRRRSELRIGRRSNEVLDATSLANFPEDGLDESNVHLRVALSPPLGPQS
jgi:hypothetical protein